MSILLTPPPERSLPAPRRQQRREQLLCQIRTEQQQRLKAPRRRWPLALATAVAVAVVAVAVVAVLPTGETGGVSPAAAAVLRHAARTAANRPETQPPALGQFVYTKSEGEFQNTAVAGHQTINYYQDVVREVWIGPDGSGRLREAEGSPRFVTNADRLAWLEAGKPDLSGDRNSDETFRPGGLSYLDLSKLPTDTAELKQLIENRSIEGGPPGDAETFTIIGDLLRETYAPPALRAALYRIAAELPGVELIGPVLDQLGRPGTAVAYVSQGLRHELIFDPETSALLGEETIVVDPSQAAGLTGKLVESASYVSSGIVDSTTSTP